MCIPFGTAQTLWTVVVVSLNLGASKQHPISATDAVRHTNCRPMADTRTTSVTFVFILYTICQTVEWDRRENGKFDGGRSAFIVYTKRGNRLHICDDAEHTAHIICCLFFKCAIATTHFCRILYSNVTDHKMNVFLNIVAFVVLSRWRKRKLCIFFFFLECICGMYFTAQNLRFNLHSCVTICEVK